jgi:hypothetical protein
MTVQRTGDWGLARNLLRTLPVQLGSAVERALRQEGEYLRREIVEGITKQSPGGEQMRPLAKTTVAARLLKGFSGTKALIWKADLRNAIASIYERGVVFVGVPRKARGHQGRPTIDIAELNEFGSDPIVVRMTVKMRKFLAALNARAGAPRHEGSGGGFAVIRIPPRPYLRPAFEKFRQGVDRRFLARVAGLLGLGGGGRLS